VLNFKLLHKLHDGLLLILWSTKICSRSTSTNKVINYITNGIMLHFFWNTLHWLLYIDILITMFWMYLKKPLMLKTNLGFFNRLILQTCLVSQVLANVCWTSISTLPTRKLCKNGDIQHWFFNQFIKCKIIRLDTS
jgi:hypothetical protein